MSLEADFSLPDGEGDRVEASRNVPAPVIVIEYRKHGLLTRLLPGALILCTAVAISSFQRKTPVWPVIPRPVVSSNTPLPPVSPPSSPLEKPAGNVGVPVPDRREPGEPPVATPAVVAENTTPAPRRSPFDLDPVDEMPPIKPREDGATASRTPDSPRPFPPSTVIDPDVPLAARVGPDKEEAVVPEPAEPSKEEILRDIEREGEQKDVRRRDMEGLKQNARSLLIGEAVSRVQSDRVTFHDELRLILTHSKGNAGEEIQKLCDRFGKEPLPQVKAAYARLLRTAPKRFTTEARVEMMRAVGVPEPLILDQLCHDFDKLINTRNGPRSEDEVRVRAARRLLALPLPGQGRKPAAGP